MLKRKKIKPITLKDVTIIDDGKLKKAITAASLGNAMEWFGFRRLRLCGLRLR